MRDPLTPLLEAVEEIRREKVRGARWALYRAVKAVIESVENGASCNDAERIAKTITSANKSMAPLYNLSLAILEGCRKSLDPSKTARRVLDYYSKSLEKIRMEARSFREPIKIITISYSSTVEALILASKSNFAKVIVLESRPGGEGALLAATLRDSGLSVELIPDTAIPLRIEEVDYVIVGADAVTRDGCLVNKLGTRQLAMIAGQAGKPVIAVFDSLKIHPESTCDSHPIEERTYMAPGYGPVRYPLFDKTPQSLVSYMLTERGVSRYDASMLREAWEDMMREILE